MEHIYICTGKCGAQISKEKYDAGLKVCGAVDCDKHGQPFEKRLKCAECSELIEDGSQHEHN